MFSNPSMSVTKSKSKNESGEEQEKGEHSSQALPTQIADQKMPRLKCNSCFSMRAIELVRKAQRREILLPHSA